MPYFIESPFNIQKYYQCASDVVRIVNRVAVKFQNGVCGAVTLSKSKLCVGDEFFSARSMQNSISETIFSSNFPTVFMREIGPYEEGLDGSIPLLWIMIILEVFHASGM